MKPPWFVIVYGAKPHGTPYKFRELADALPRDRFKIVALDEFFAAAEKARPQVERRGLAPQTQRRSQVSVRAEGLPPASNHVPSSRPAHQRAVSRRVGSPGG